MSEQQPAPLTKSILEAAGFIVKGNTATITTQAMPPIPGATVSVKAINGRAFIEGEITESGVKALADHHGMSVDEVRSHLATMMQLHPPSAE